MRPVLFSDEIRSLEAEAVAAGAASMAELMRRAGEAVARSVLEMAPSGRVLLVCGSGNNGGDGWVAARALLEHGLEVFVLSVADPGRLPEPARTACADASAAGVPWRRIGSAREVRDFAQGAALVVDAVLGIGLAGPVREDTTSVLAALAEVEPPVLAVDVPSGVDADTGALLGPVAGADNTVTFTCLKPGLLLYPAAAYAGEVEVVDVGLDAPARRAHRVEVWDDSDYAAALPIPAPDAHKGDRGSVLVVAGSRLYAGAAVLAAAGAMRVGAGSAQLEGLARLREAVGLVGPDSPLRSQLRNEAIELLALRDLEAGPVLESTGAWGVAFAADGNRVATLADDGAELVLHDPQAIAPTRQATVPDGEVIQ